MLAQAAAAVDQGAVLRNNLLQVGPFALVAIALYVRWVAMLKARPGGVSTERFGVPDLIVTFLLSLFFTAIAYLQFTATAPQVFSVEVLIESSVFELVLIVFLGSFLFFRKVPVASFLSLRLHSPGSAARAGRALSALRVSHHRPAQRSPAAPSHAPEEQQIVSYFRERARLGDFRGITAVSLTAVVVAPFFEELFFRGYFYPTLKRYVGPVVSSILVSALFACIHANVQSLLPLFGLALCLTIAYEWTGSLLVPMTMHAMFNSVNLLLMYATMVKPSPSPLTP